MTRFLNWVQGIAFALGGPGVFLIAVLDSSFRVRGIKGLRVVDASVFPKIPGFFVVMPTYMISEKAADVIHAEAQRVRVLPPLLLDSANPVANLIEHAWRAHLYEGEGSYETRYYWTWSWQPPRDVPVPSPVTMLRRQTRKPSGSSDASTNQRPSGSTWSCVPTASTGPVSAADRTARTARPRSSSDTTSAPVAAANWLTV